MAAITTIRPRDRSVRPGQSRDCVYARAMLKRVRRARWALPVGLLIGAALPASATAVASASASPPSPASVVNQWRPQAGPRLPRERDRICHRRRVDLLPAGRCSDDRRPGADPGAHVPVSRVPGDRRRQGWRRRELRRSAPVLGARAVARHAAPQRVPGSTGTRFASRLSSEQRHAPTRRTGSTSPTNSAAGWRKGRTSASRSTASASYTPSSAAPAR